MSTFVNSINRSFEKYETKNAFIYGDETFSYGRIKEAIDRFAQCLVDSGVGKGDAVVILLPNLVQFPISYFAAISIGAIAVPVNFLHSRTQLQSQLNSIQPRAIIVWDKILPKTEPYISSGTQSVFVLGENVPFEYQDFTRMLTETEPATQFPEIADDDTALIVFTPGNSGEPKAIEMSHGALSKCTLMFRESFLLNSSESFLAAMPLFLIVSQIVLLNSVLFSGANVLLFPAFNNRAILNRIKELNSVVVFGNKSLVCRLFTDGVPGDVNEKIKYCIVYGDCESPNDVEVLAEAMDGRFFEGYALSEAGAFVALNRESLGRRKGSVGLPMEGVYILVVDELGNPVAENEAGEILVKAPGMMKGYWKQLESDSHLMPDGWFNTGDIGRIDSDGYLHVLERKENVILKDGFYVFPREIELCLAEHQNIKEVAVVGVSDATHGQEVKACIVLQQNTSVSPSEIKSFCQNQFELYKCPQHIQFYTQLPKSATGRILKYLLKES